MSKYAYILLVKEKWWKRRIAQHHAGKKVQTFVRKNTVGLVDATLLLFYIGHLVREIRGTGDFEKRAVGKAEELWKDYSKETVFKSHNEYLEFKQE